MANKKTTTKKPSSKPKAPRTKKSEVEEFMEIGGSPVPGITLRQVLRGHTGEIFRISWSAYGHRLASPSEDGTIRIWDVHSGKCVKVFDDEVQSEKLDTVWSPDGKKLLVTLDGKKLYLWDTMTTASFPTSIPFGLFKAWSPSSNNIAVFSEKHLNNINIYDIETGKIRKVLARSKDFEPIFFIWSPDGNKLVSANTSGYIIIWNTLTGQIERELKEHWNTVTDLQWLPGHDNLLASSSADMTIKIWDIQSGKVIQNLEKHTVFVSSISFSMDGALLVSKGPEVCIWDTKTWSLIGQIEERQQNELFNFLAFHPSQYLLATLGEDNKTLRIWEIDYNTLMAVVGTAMRFSQYQIAIQE